MQINKCPCGERPYFRYLDIDTPGEQFLGWQARCEHNVYHVASHDSIDECIVLWNRRCLDKIFKVDQKSI